MSEKDRFQEHYRREMGKSSDRPERGMWDEYNLARNLRAHPLSRLEPPAR